MSSNDLQTLEPEIERLKCELDREASLRSHQSLFDENQPGLDEKSTPNGESNVVDIAAYKRQKNKPSKESIKRIVIIPVKNKICSCGCEKKVIRYEVREFYHHVPAIFG